MLTASEVFPIQNKQINVKNTNGHYGLEERVWKCFPNFTFMVKGSLLTDVGAVFNEKELFMLVTENCNGQF